MLPDWNDLPQELRKEMIEEASFYCDPPLAGDCAVNIYKVLREKIPPQTFPLFTRPNSEGE